METNKCDYSDVIKDKSICALRDAECDKSDTSCRTAEEYCIYLTEAGVTVASRDEIEEILDDSGTI